MTTPLDVRLPTASFSRLSSVFNIEPAGSIGRLNDHMLADIGLRREQLDMMNDAN